MSLLVRHYYNVAWSHIYVTSMSVVAIKNIEAAYRLNIISWQGDPCLPQEYRWNYIECNYSNNSIPPRIISL